MAPTSSSVTATASNGSAPDAARPWWAAAQVVVGCVALVLLIGFLFDAGLGFDTGWVTGVTGVAAVIALVIMVTAGQKRRVEAQALADLKQEMLRRDETFQQRLHQLDVRWRNHSDARATAFEETAKYLVEVRLPAAMSDSDVPPPPEGQNLDKGVLALLGKAVDEMVEADTRQREQMESLRVAVVSLSRRVQTSSHQIQETVSLMAERHAGDPDVLESSWHVDHAAAQQGRLAQSLAVLCGEWPGQQWPKPLALVDVVKAAASRIVPYKRVKVTGDPDTAASAHVVEPLIHMVAEALANATQCSPPATDVLVAVRNVQRGAVVEIDDGGVGMDEHSLDKAREVISGHRPVGLDGVGEIPQTGLAVIGGYARRYGFTADLMESPYGGLRVVIRVPAEMVETLVPAGSVSAPAPAPAPIRTIPDQGTALMGDLPPRQASPARTIPSQGAAPVADLPMRQAPARTVPTQGAAPVADLPSRQAPPPAQGRVTPVTRSPESEQGGNDTGQRLPHRRSRREERRARRAEAGYPPAPAGGPPADPAPMQTPEQAGAWMQAYFDSRPDGATADDEAAPAAGDDDRDAG
jgi:hypothetical protein